MWGIAFPIILLNLVLLLSKIQYNDNCINEATGQQVFQALNNNFGLQLFRGLPKLDQATYMQICKFFYSPVQKITLESWKNLTWKLWVLVGSELCCI